MKLSFRKEPRKILAKNAINGFLYKGVDTFYTPVCPCNFVADAVREKNEKKKEELTYYHFVSLTDYIRGALLDGELELTEVGELSISLV